MKGIARVRRYKPQLPRAIALGCLVASPCVAYAAPPAGYELFWGDEFNDVGLDESSWWYRADEKQQSIQLPSNVELDGGHLVLNLTPLATPINGFDAAGAGVISQQRFRYGYYETRGKLGDGINDDNDGETDEGWWHAFWAMAAEGDENGHVQTTFPSFRRTEIDGFENGSNNLSRFTQHVLPWNAEGRITAKLPSNDVTTIPSSTINDWHTYGFEWTPDEVRFYVDDVLTKVAVYPASVYEHDEINVWLTAISTNGQSSDQERSEARYDYFRFYKPGDIVVADGEELRVGNELDLYAGSSGGTITAPGFGTAAVSSGGVAGELTAQGGATVYGSGTVWGSLTLEAGATLDVGQLQPPAVGGGAPITVTETFESFTPGSAFGAGAPSGLLPDWEFFDLGVDSGDAVFSITGADGSAAQPSDPSLTGESQMLFQTNPSIDFALEQIGGEPFAGAVAVSNQFDTSGAVDRIGADFVFDGFGDTSGSFLDAKIVFGFRDIDNWFSLSLVAGDADGSSVQIDVIENVAGVRNNIFSASGTGDFITGFPQDSLLHAEIVHDADNGYVAFSIVDPVSGEVLAESFTVNDAFKHDGLVGFAVNNDALGIDNLSVTTGTDLPGHPLQTFMIDGDYVQEAGATLTLQITGDSSYDRLEVTGAAELDGTLELQLDADYSPQIGDRFVVMAVEEGIAGSFESVASNLPPGNLALAITYEAQQVVATAALYGDANLDGTISQADLDAVLLNWGDAAGTWARGDFNADGWIGQADLDAVLLNWGSTSVNAANPIVPEPASGSALLGLVLLTRYRAKRASFS